MKISLGTDVFSVKDGRPYKRIIDLEKVINPHMFLVGGSGTGKTYNLKNLASILASFGAKVYIFDVHGDINPSGASTIKFSETSPYGINPLEISNDPDFGGVRKTVRNFIASINRTSRKLGPNQEAVLEKVLYDLFAANGFYKDDPKTWSLNYDPRTYTKYPKKYPNIPDLRKFLNAKLNQIFFGTNSKCMQELEKLKKEKFKYLRLLKNASKSKTLDSDEIQKKIEQIKENMIEYFTESVRNIDTGYELENLIIYDSPDTVKGLLNRISSLENSGIFKSKEPEFDHNTNIYRYNISPLNRDEQKMFVDIMSRKIFEKARERGVVPYPQEFIIIDEAAIFLQDAEPDYILNIIAREARKFGLGLILATQSMNHIPEDIVDSTATKIILGVDEQKMDAVSKKLQIDKKILSSVE
jgi:DNA helicase HerA-like ATPase